MYVMRVRMDSCLMGAASPLLQWRLQVDAGHFSTFGGINLFRNSIPSCPRRRWPGEACDSAVYDITFVLGREYASAFVPTLAAAFIYPWQPQDWADVCVVERGGSSLHSKGTPGLTLSAECVLALHARSVGPVYELDTAVFRGLSDSVRDAVRSQGRTHGTAWCDRDAAVAGLNSNVTALLGG